MIHTHAEFQSQKSFGSKVKSGNKRTDRQMDKGNCITFHANAVAKYWTGL